MTTQDLNIVVFCLTPHGITLTKRRSLKTWYVPYANNSNDNGISNGTDIVR